MAAPAADRAPAGFWARYAAWSLDAACLVPLVALLGGSRVGHAARDARTAFDALAADIPRLLGDALLAPQSPVGLARQVLADPALAAASDRLKAALAGMIATPMLLYALLALLYSVGFERSPWQATPGKRALGLVVADARGRRLKAGHAVLRFLAADLSWLTLNLGHAMAAFPPRHLALHDLASGTRVSRRGASATLPAWAKAWLLAQLLATALAIAWLFLWLQAVLQAGLQQVLGGS